MGAGQLPHAGFGRRVYDLAVHRVDGTRLNPRRTGNARYEISCAGEAFNVSYRVFAFEASVRSAYLDQQHGFWNGTSLFFMIEQARSRPHRVTVNGPKGWRITTALPRVTGKTNQFLAVNADVLLDSPFEVGRQTVSHFSVGRTRFDVAWCGWHNGDEKRLLSGMRSIVKATGAMMGGFPFKRYVFIVHAVSSRGGGLEHADSCTLNIPRDMFDGEAGYHSYFALVAHEFFHVWNVKRLQDTALRPYDYGRENHTELLWFHEGFTQYMECPILMRAGLLSPEGYLKSLAASWSSYKKLPAATAHH